MYNRLCLFNMCVVADVVLAVAMEAAAPGAIPKLQLRIADIRFSTDGAFVVIGCFHRLRGSLVRTGGGEGYGLAFGRFPRLSAE